MEQVDEVVVKLHPLQWQRVLDVFGATAMSVSGDVSGARTGEIVSPRFMFTKEVCECPFCGNKVGPLTKDGGVEPHP